MDLSTAPSQTPSEYRVNLELLVKIPFFAGSPMELLKVVAYLCRREAFRPGEIVFHQDETGGNAYYILSGTAALMRDGDQPIRTYSEGDFIGSMSLFCDMKRLFTLKASSDLTCLTLSGEKFRKAVERSPETGSRMIKGIVTSIYQWEQTFMGQHGQGCACCRQYLGISLV